MEGGVDPQPLKIIKTAHLLPDKLCVFLTGKEDIAQQELDLGCCESPFQLFLRHARLLEHFLSVQLVPRKKLGDLGRPSPDR